MTSVNRGNIEIVLFEGVTFDLEHDKWTRQEWERQKQIMLKVHLHISIHQLGIETILTTKTCLFENSRLICTQINCSTSIVISQMTASWI